VTARASFGREHPCRRPASERFIDSRAAHFSPIQDSPRLIIKRPNRLVPNRNRKVSVEPGLNIKLGLQASRGAATRSFFLPLVRRITRSMIPAMSFWDGKPSTLQYRDRGTRRNLSPARAHTLVIGNKPSRRAAGCLLTAGEPSLTIVTFISRYR